MKLGAILLRGSDAEWRENVALFKRMRGQVAKCHISVGFGTSWQDVEYLIAENPQLTSIIYRTEDRIISAEAVERDLVDRGFWEIVKRHPQLEHWCEVGNEVEHTGMDHWVYRWLLLDTVLKLKPKFPGLKWIASMPVRLDHTIDVLAGDAHGRVEDLYDSLGVHVYGHYHLHDGGGGEWLNIYDYLLQHTSLPLILSEFGVNDDKTPKAEKGKRYLDWLTQQPARLTAATVFVIGKWEHDRYRVDSAMADVLGSRVVPPVVPEPEPDMPYTGNSLIHSTGRASAATIDAWMARKGQQLAKDYAPDKTYKAPPPVGEAIVRLSGQVGVNSDLVAAQICKESAGWQSRIVRDKNNPSGLGAVNNNPYAGAITFDTPEAGIKATIAHLLTYTKGRSNPWWNLDPRASAVPQQNLGIVRTLSDLDGRWAWPGDGYGAGIAALANDLVQSQPEQEQPAMPRIIVSAGHENIRNITAEKIGSSSQANLRGGSGAGGIEATWTAPWADHLAHLLREMGVDVVRTDAIYHADAYGKRADLVISGHCDGTGGRKAQHCQAAAVVSGNSHDSADARAQQFVDLWYDIYPQASGIRGDGPITVGMRQYYGGWYRTPDSPMVLLEHQILADANGVRNDGIDPVRAAEIDAEVVRRFFGLAAYQDVPARDPNAREFPETGHWIVNLPEAPLLAFYEANGDVERFGLPLSGMVQREDGAFEQMTENALLEAYPAGFGPYPGPHVRIGGLGQRLIAAQQRIKELEAA